MQAHRRSFYPFERLRESVTRMSPTAGAKPLKTRRLKSANGCSQELLKSGTFPPPTGGKNSSTRLPRKFGGERCFSGTQRILPTLLLTRLGTGPKGRTHDPFSTHKPQTLCQIGLFRS